MRKNLKRMAALLSAALMFVSAAPSYAKEGEVKMLYYSKKSNKESKVWSYYGNTEHKMTNDNTKVVTGSQKKLKTGKYLRTWKIKGTGTANTSDGTFKVMKYKSPLKSLKVGKKNLTSKYKYSLANSGKKLKGKLTIKTKNGWKFVKAYKFRMAELTGEIPGGTNQIPLSKGKKINIKKGERLILCFRKGSQEMSLRYTAK